MSKINNEAVNEPLEKLFELLEKAKDGDIIKGGSGCGKAFSSSARLLIILRTNINCDICSTIKEKNKWL